MSVDAADGKSHNAPIITCLIYFRPGFLTSQKCIDFSLVPITTRGDRLAFLVLRGGKKTRHNSLANPPCAWQRLGRANTWPHRRATGGSSPAGGSARVGGTPWP